MCCFLHPIMNFRGQFIVYLEVGQVFSEQYLVFNLCNKNFENRLTKTKVTCMSKNVFECGISMIK